MPSSNYKAASAAYSSASSYAKKADRYAGSRMADMEVANIRQEQLHRDYGAASQAIGIGKNLWDVYSANKENIEYAKDLPGIEKTSGWWNDIFGDPTYKDTVTGKDVTSDMIRATKYVEDYYADDSMTDTLHRRKREKEKIDEQNSYMLGNNIWDTLKNIGHEGVR